MVWKSDSKTKKRHRGMDSTEAEGKSESHQMSVQRCTSHLLHQQSATPS